METLHIQFHQPLGFILMVVLFYSGVAILYKADKREAKANKRGSLYPLLCLLGIKRNDSSSLTTKERILASLLMSAGVVGGFYSMIPEINLEHIKEAVLILLVLFCLVYFMLSPLKRR